MQLNVLDKWPSGLEDFAASDLHQALPGPTLIHLGNKQQRRLFISVLLHGNEHVGWEVARLLIPKLDSPQAPPVSLFIGNIAAARLNQRRLQNQPDYNRIWGSENTAEGSLGQQVFAEMQQTSIFASVDVHNNSGKNPMYSCVSNLDDTTLSLACLFSPLVLQIIQPQSTLCATFASLSPAITVEAGCPGELRGLQQVKNLVENLLSNQSITTFAKQPRLYRIVARIEVADYCPFSFAPGQALQLLADIENYNFKELPTEHTFAYINPHQSGLDSANIKVIDNNGEDTYNQYFYQHGKEIRTKRKLVPAMFTLDTKIIKQDCLCYIIAPKTA